MATTRTTTKVSADDRRLFPVVDRLLILFIAIELLALPFVPLLPLGIAAVALTTPLGTSRKRMLVLWILGGILALVVAAPSILRLFDLQLVDNGPLHTIDSR